jgi:LacI family transcriptional regulator
VCVHERDLKNLVINTTNKIRIKDIARLADVSEGTVDRVIHNRGQVAEDSRAKIQKIIDELNYKPNLLARSLANKKNYVFTTLLPLYNKGTGEYWEAPLVGINRAWQEIADYNITIKNLYFDQFNVESYREMVAETLSMNPDAVLISPVFRDETIKLTSNLDKSNIPYIFIDSTIDGLNNLAYFGQNSFQSGYLAAKLLENGLTEGAKIAIIKPSGATILNQVKIREYGFKKYFEERGLGARYSFCSLSQTATKASRQEERLLKFLETNDPVSAAVVFNSRVFEIAQVIEKYQIKNIRLIGYDLLTENENLLRKGVVSYLIAQRPEDQGYMGIMSFFNHIFLKKDILKDNYMPIDILTTENLEYYINFNK